MTEYVTDEYMTGVYETDEQARQGRNLWKPSIVEGCIPFSGYDTYYRIVGESQQDKLPLLVIHGGPGVPHHYLRSLDALARDYGRQVVYYDQSGCGGSLTPARPHVWSVDFFLEELIEVREALHLDAVHILGQSWGGMLAMLYTSGNPAGIASLVAASSPASMDLWIREANRLIDQLPEPHRAALVKARKLGDFSTPEATQATAEYYRRHVCAFDPKPQYARIHNRGEEVYRIMAGPNEFTATGTLRNWDIVDRLESITVPVLVTTGEHDEATPAVAQQLLDHIPNATWSSIPGGTHCCHLEFPEIYNALVENFLESHE